MDANRKVVVVTGAGGGLGRALSVTFVQHGYRVVGFGRNSTNLEATADQAGSDDFSFEMADVAEFDQVKAAVDSVIQRHGRIDLLFNNAAVYPKVSFLDESAEEWAAAMGANVNGVANCCKAILPHMIESGFGRIFNVGSFADLRPIRDSAAYSASKGALRALTKAIAADLAHLDLDIEVHEWVPGHLNTQMSDFTGFDPAISASWALQMAEVPHARTKNCIFENDHEWLPAKGIRHRIMEKVFFWREFA